MKKAVPGVVGIVVIGHCFVFAIKFIMDRVESLYNKIGKSSSILCHIINIAKYGSCPRIAL